MIDDIRTPYSVIPMIYPLEEKLLSDWPPDLCQKAYRVTKPIDPQILTRMRMVGNICYAPNPGTKGRNQMPYASLEANKDPSKTSNENIENCFDKILDYFIIFR